MMIEIQQCRKIFEILKSGRCPPRSDRVEQCYMFAEKVGYREKNDMPQGADLCLGLPGLYTVNCWTEYNGQRSAITSHRYDIRHPHMQHPQLN